MNAYIPSLLDRLTDPSFLERNASSFYSLEQLKDSILRDLHELLNCKRVGVDAFLPQAVIDEILRKKHLQWSDQEQILQELLPHVNYSVARFGVRDATHIRSRDENEQRYATHLEDVIAACEPRLREVRVEPIPPNKVAKPRAQLYHLGAAHFRIHATLNVDEAPPDSFVLDTARDFSTGMHDLEVAITSETSE
jgi:type VI secretion system lysozyme-like protein